MLLEGDYHLGFRVWSFGFRVLGFGFRVSGSGLRVYEKFPFFVETASFLRSLP